MGMDVCGKAPRTELGRYFSNNVTWWHPLADYCCLVAPEICASCKHWHSNNNDGLDDAKAAALAKILIASINDHSIDAYAQAYALALEKSPKKKCIICDGTGIRHSTVFERACLNFNTEFVPPSRPANDSCIFCEGKGLLVDGDRFSIENVARFAAFLMDCGGFSID